MSWQDARWDELAPGLWGLTVQIEADTAQCAAVMMWQVPLSSKNSARGAEEGQDCCSGMFGRLHLSLEFCWFKIKEVNSWEKENFE